MFLVRYTYADADLRARHRAEHLARLTDLAEQGIVLVAGPEEDGRGAVVVLMLDDAAAVHQVMDADPYLRSGAVLDYSVEPFTAVVASPAVPRESPSDPSRSIK